MRGQTDSESAPPESLGSHLTPNDRRSERKSVSKSSSDNTNSEYLELCDFMDRISFAPSGNDDSGQRSRFKQSAKRTPDSQNIPQNFPALGYCKLLGHKDLNDVWPFSLIEVRPVGNPQDGDSYSATDLLEIRHAPSNCLKPRALGSKTGKDEQSEQFVAALGAVGKTPHRTKLSFQHLAHLQTVAGPHKLPSAADKYTDGALKESAPPNAGGLRNEGDASKPQHNANKISNEKRQFHKTSDGTETDLAYQRLLNKLTKKSTRPISLSEPVSKHTEWHGDKRHPGKLGTDQRLTEANKPNTLRQRDNGNRSSDSGYGSLPSNCNTDSTGPGYKSSNDGFNPRAREFLSFAGKTQPAGDSDDYQNFRRIQIEDLFSKPGVSTRLDAPGADAPPSYNHIPPLMPGYHAPFVPPPAVGVPYNSTNPYFELNTMFPANLTYPAATWSPGQLAPFSNFALPTATSLPTSMVNGGNWGSGVPNNVTNTGYIPLPGAGMIPPPDLMAKAGTNVSVPPAGNHTPSSCPGPIPKPRVPDPRKQQEYEAWIEWRKANEPGYAMECKLRQQRRSQRNAASKSKSESVTKSEAAVIS